MSRTLYFAKMQFQGLGCVLLLCCVLCLIGSLLVAEGHVCNSIGLSYTRDQLIALRPTAVAGEKPEILEKLRTRRGCRVGVKWRMKKRRFKLCIPVIIRGNVRSLANKMEELEALVKTQRDYKECSIMCFTESWLHKQKPDSNVTIPGFHTVRPDRDTTANDKK